MAPGTRRGARPADPNPRLVQSLQRLTRVVGQLAAGLDDVRETQRMNVKRIGQLQAELDALKHPWAKMQGM